MSEQEMKDVQEIENLKKEIQRLHFELDTHRRKPTGQNTGRTLIDCLNHYLTCCPVSCDLVVKNKDYKWSLELSRNGALLHKVDEAVNIQACYEDMLEWVVSNAIIK